MAITISLEVSIDDGGANLNEICGEVKERIVGELSAKVAEQIIEGLQERVNETLTQPSGRAAKKGLGGHEAKGAKGNRCQYRTFVKQGRRERPRRVKTDIGVLSFSVARVSCVGCGKKFEPILDVLGLERRAGRSGGLDRMVSEVVSTTSYQRGEAEIEARGGPPVPRTTAHRWAAELAVPDSDPAGCVYGMADGTGFKKWPKARGDLRVVIGLDSQGKPKPLGAYSGESWERIGKKTAKKLKKGKEKQLKLFAVDGEPGLDAHLASVAEKSQRCVWHLPRDLGYAMWGDQAPLEERKQAGLQLGGLVGIEVPAGDWEAISPQDKKAFEEAIESNERQIKAMTKQFEEKGYRKAATYLDNAFDHIFSHARLWLETGIVAPRTTSILENIMRELGRRVKKLGWNWSDEGVVRIAKMVLLRRYDQAQWEAFWKETLGLKGRCRITIKKIARKAA